MKETFDIQEYMTKGVERVISDSLKATAKNPRETAYLLKFAAASRRASRLRKKAEKAGEHVPPLLIASITSSCNLHCAGCYARGIHSTSDEKPEAQLTAGEWDAVFKEAEELGISFIMLVGGEPLLRKDIISKASEHPDILFPVFTNGTYIDEEYFSLFDRCRNLVPVISMEGGREQTDVRRGEGIYDLLLDNMHAFREKNMIFGVSITVTTENVRAVSSDAFLTELAKLGCKLVVYIEYVPTAEEDAHLAPTDRERSYLDSGIIRLRQELQDMVYVSFPGDEKASGGCIAAGRGLFHINSHGGAEPCPFSPYSDINVKDTSLKEAIRSKLFRELREGDLLEDDHSGGCVLFEKRSQVENIMRKLSPGSEYDFTSILDRQGMDAIAVEPETDPYGIAPKGEIREGFDLIPMWVADMNFPTVPTVCEALIERAKHPAFGYFAPREEYYESILRWQRERNLVEGLERRHIGYQNGVLGGVVSALQVLCSPGDRVLVHAPTYVGFLEEVAGAGYTLIGSDLVKDEDGIWRMDYEDMERKIREYRIHTMIFCSPHNPTGRVWRKEELERAFEIFARYDVYVVSDEIWSDLTLRGNRHIPLQSVSEDARKRTIAFYAPSKTFNLAGLVGSYHIIYNDYLRARVKRQSNLTAYNSMNVLSMHALIGAYKPEGAAWVDELRQVLTKNVDFAVDFIRTHFSGVEVSLPEGTYMLLLDCGEWLRAHEQKLDQLLRAGVEVGVLWQDGRQFDRPDSIRMNLALPFSRVKEAFRRLDEYVF